jgi:hypothetical protein
VPPIRAEFVEKALAPQRLGPLVQPEPAAPPRQPTFAGAPLAREPAAAPTPPSRPAPDPSPPGRGFRPPFGPPPRWHLRLDMEAHPATVRPGEEVVYTLRVGNVGDGVFRGDVAVESHVPFRTTSRQPARCRGGSAGADPDAICRRFLLPAPGSPTQSAAVHGVSFRGVQVEIPPGAALVYQFAVTVDPGVPPGTEIDNHGHLEVVGEGHRTTSRTATVRTR